MTKSNPVILGLGYEGLTIDEYLQHLLDWEIDIVIDVRLNPISRKRGFSKTKLGQAITEAGMEYMHRRELGNPKDNRDGFATPHTPAGQASQELYLDIIGSEAGDTAIQDIADLLESNRIALLCFEADERCCHRKLVRQQVMSRLDDRVTILH